MIVPALSLCENKKKKNIGSHIPRPPPLLCQIPNDVH
jgi:hypothetical protein